MDRQEAVPKVAVLDGFTDAIKENQGISLSELGAGRVLVVETQNSTYTITVLDPTERTIEVVGGRYFPKPEICILSDSTFGGANLRMGWIGLGMCMEFHRSNTEPDKKRVTTSLVIAALLPGPTSNYVH